jgi:hypothetical protein
MKTKTTLLVASIIAAVMIATPLAIIAQQGEETAITKDVTTEEFLAAQEKVLDLRSEQNKLEKDIEEFGKSVERIQRISEIDSQIALYMPILEKYEEQRKALYYIEPARRQQLESVEMDLRQRVDEFGRENGIYAYAVNIDTLDKKIVVLTSDAAYNDQIRAMFEKYPSDIPIEIINGEVTVTDQACAYQTDDCDPIVGGIKAQGANHGPCTLGLPVQKSWIEYGFITAGHCVSNNESLYQPVNTSGTYKIGDSTSSYYEGTCDCAYVKKTTWTTSKSQIWRSSNNYLTVTSEASSRPADGTQIVLSGMSSGFKFGEVVQGTFTITADGINWNLVRHNIVTQGGDSGAPVGNADASKILAIHKGVITVTPPIGPPMNYYVATGWNNIDAKFSVSLH